MKRQASKMATSFSLHDHRATSIRLKPLETHTVSSHHYQDGLTLYEKTTSSSSLQDPYQLSSWRTLPLVPCKVRVVQHRRGPQLRTLHRQICQIPIWKWLATYKGGYSEGAVLAYSNDEAFQPPRASYPSVKVFVQHLQPALLMERDE